MSFSIVTLEDQTSVTNSSKMKLTDPALARFRIFLMIALLGSSVLINCGPNNNFEFKFEKLLVEYAVDPINIDIQHPRFSWVVSSDQRNQQQSAYQIIVASKEKFLSNNKSDLWNSGKIISDETIHHEYEGIDLQSNTHYFWKVIFWDKSGTPHESPIAKFETALLNSSDWKANWIGKESGSESVPAQGFYKDRKEESGIKDTIIHDGISLLLRREIELTKKILSAKAFITGLGLYEFYINGSRVGDYLLAPAKTPYHKYILYDTYDVTDLLKDKWNTFGIHLGNGWYNPYKKWWNEYRMQWFGSKKAIAQIMITYTDGTSQTITTDKNWKWSHGPVTYNCIYDGEVYNANLDHSRWASNGYDDSNWQPVKVFNSPTVRLVSHRMPAIKAQECFVPHEIVVSRPGMKVYDMGQNFAGTVKVHAKGNRNTILKIRFAEDINQDGTIDPTSNENARATAEYIMKGDSIETYEPHFTWFGFKYVEITSENGPLDIRKVEGIAIYSANYQTGSLECNNLLINKLHKATVWSQKSNMIGYPMDCPQRDERLGWLGDAQVTVEEAMFNFDMALFYENWLEGIRENQDEKTGDIPIISPRPYIKDDGVEWSSTYFTLLWQYYIQYGDRQILKHHYPAMKKYMAFLQSISKEHILPKGWIGDWGSMVKGWKEGEPESVPTAFYFLDAKIISQVAQVLGEDSDYQYYKKLSDEIGEKYNKTYLNVETSNYNDGSQMANAFPLYLGIVPDNQKDKVLNNLVVDIVEIQSSHLTTGVLGTKYMPEALARLGRADVAWKIINQKSYPSWNSMMDKYTTVCEFWTLKQSKNHVMMGSIDAWFYKYIAGIQLDDKNPAFRLFVIKPQLLDSLGSAKAKVETIRGTISSEWEKSPNMFLLKVDVPFNTSALVHIPANKDWILYEGNVNLTENKNLKYLGYFAGAHLIKIDSGIYHFKAVSDLKK